jgi:hypothetical protein
MRVLQIRTVALEIADVQGRLLPKLRPVLNASLD